MRNQWQLGFALFCISNFTQSILSVPFDLVAVVVLISEVLNPFVPQGLAFCPPCFFACHARDRKCYHWSCNPSSEHIRIFTLAISSDSLNNSPIILLHLGGDETERKLTRIRVMMMAMTMMTIMMTMTMMMTWKRWCKVRSKECFSSAAKHFTLNLQFAAFRSWFPQHQLFPGLYPLCW